MHRYGGSALMRAVFLYRTSRCRVAERCSRSSSRDYISRNMSSARSKWQKTPTASRPSCMKLVSEVILHISLVNISVSTRSGSFSSPGSMHLSLTEQAVDSVTRLASPFISNRPYFKCTAQQLIDNAACGWASLSASRRSRESWSNYMNCVFSTTAVPDRHGST